ncbi:MAG: dihydrouridine synthase [Verrucomicrobia bacterium]|nr:MAG: dihydrouridine synthase [Verrucomicrobiota bacterium]
MQDVTDLSFMTVINECGPPDYFFTEFIRVHEHSIIEESILDSITKNPSNRPVFAQLIGESLPNLRRIVKELGKYPIAGIDLNMGCPAPKVYKKNVGGGLLKDVEKIDQILGLLRQTIPGLFTVKMRIGFEDTDNFEKVLALINKHQVDLLSVHGRTVKELYRGDVHYDFIKKAVESVNCPVLANGNITSVQKAVWALNYTGSHGVMIGRSAIRNPWIFLQLRQHLSGHPYFQPRLQDVYIYIERLLAATHSDTISELQHVNRMKKFLNFVGQGVDPQGQFLHEMRRTRSYDGLLAVSKKHLLDNDNNTQPFATEPHPGLIARINCES